MTRHAQEPARDAERREFAQESDSLWRLALPPTIWAVNFVLCYVVVSLACARGLFDVDTARLWLIGASALALGVILWKGWQAFGDWGPERDLNDESLADDRHQFIAHASFLIAIISAIGTVFTALPLILLEGCQ